MSNTQALSGIVAMQPYIKYVAWAVVIALLIFIIMTVWYHTIYEWWYMNGNKKDKSK